MPRLRQTIRRSQIVADSNAAILAADGPARREAIAIITSRILLNGEAYAGFYYCDTKGLPAHSDSDTSDRTYVQFI